MIKVICFDLWDTIGDKSYSIVTKIIETFGLNCERKDILYDYESSTQLKKWNSVSDMSKTVLSKLGVETSDENVKKMNYIFEFSTDGIEFIEGMEEILDSLKDKVRLILLSNTNVNQFEDAKEKFDLENKFDKLYPSFEIGYIKPDSFETLINLEKVNSNEILLVDNAEHNCVEAKKIGMQVIVFKSASQLKNELGDLGIL